VSACYATRECVVQELSRALRVPYRADDDFLTIFVGLMTIWVTTPRRHWPEIYYTQFVVEMLASTPRATP
jgi:hypothetical protein